DDHVNDLALAADGGLWLAQPSGLGHFQDGKFGVAPIPDDITSKGVLGLAAANDSSVWLAGDNFVGRFDGKWHLTSAFDNPEFMDRFDRVVLDEQMNPWFVGETGLIHWDSDGWTSFSPEKTDATPMAARGSLPDGLSFPDPHKNYLE